MKTPSLIGIEEAAADLVDTETAAGLLGLRLTSSNLCGFGQWLDARVQRRFCWYPGDLQRNAETGTSISPGYFYKRAEVEGLLLGEQFGG